jgi:hypothetical protein
MSALALLLADFGEPIQPARHAPAQRVAARPALPDFDPAPFDDVSGGADALAPQDPANARDLEEALAAARAEGIAQGRAEADADAGLRLARAQAEASQAQAAALAQARALWAKAEGEALAARLDAALATLRGEIEEGVAAVLRPLAAAAAAREAARLMAGEIARLVASPEAGQGPPLEIAGPADIIDAVRDALDADPRVGPAAAREGRVRFVEAEGVDAFARLGRAEVETRLAAFARALERPE